MVAATQFINIQRGQHEVAIDLSAQQADSLKSNNRLKVQTQPSTWVFWLFANNNPSISTATSNKRFQAGVRAALDYPSFVRLAGGGAIQARGIIPSMFLGSLPPPRRSVKRDLNKAKSEIAASGVGNQTFTLEFPSDLTINGVAFTTLAQRVQANLQEAGLQVELAGAPAGTWLDKYRSGRMAFGLSFGARTTPTRPTTSRSCRASSSGSGSAGRRRRPGAGAAGRDGARHDARRSAGTDLPPDPEPAERVGAVLPLIQPTQVFAATSDLQGAVFNPLYSIDVRLPRPAS